jgi:diguanylate cyclase (GGDEF)-like protein
MNEKKLHVLLAEADADETATALRALYAKVQDGLELTNVSSVSTLIATLEIVNPEVIFLDLSLAQPDPLDGIRRVHRSAPSVPLIVVADSSDKDCAVRSLSQGALDYLIKGFIDSRTLERTLRAALEHNMLDGLADLLRDPLTRLYTRDGFLTLGESAMETAKKRNSTLVLLCMRIENLEALRANFGPGAVDHSLCEVAAMLLGSFRGTDIVARLGESQFAALAVDAAEPSAPVLCQRLEKRIAMLNRDVGPWRPLELRTNVRFWSPKETIAFSELLDTVEAGLRFTAVSPGGETTSHKRANETKEA